MLTIQKMDAHFKNTFENFYNVGIEKIAGLVHAARGALELFEDPSCRFYNKAFDPSKRVILYCAGRVRAASAGKP